MDKLMNRPNASIAVAVGCLDQQEYSILKVLFIL
jgi:hypothetical protein